MFEFDFIIFKAMRVIRLTLLTASLFFLFLAFDSSAQEAIVPRPSPLAIVSTRYKSTYFKLTYSQPHKRGRQVFGAMVPFGELWRTGANEATEITVTRNIQVNGTLLLAGTYSLFTIPGEKKWTIIINSEPGLWGSYNYNKARDVMRFDVPVQTIPGDLVYEAFTIQLNQKNETANLLLLWDKTRISIPIKFLD
jgi:hypothetical protein